MKIDKAYLKSFLYNLRDICKNNEECDFCLISNLCVNKGFGIPSTWEDRDIEELLDRVKGERQ